MWTLYVEDELVDLISDLEMLAIIREAESGEHVRIDLVLDLIREVAIIC
jgi:hypothetical protein